MVVVQGIAQVPDMQEPPGREHYNAIKNFNAIEITPSVIIYFLPADMQCNV